MKYLLATAVLASAVLASAVLASAVLAHPLQAANLPYHESQAWFCQQCTDINSARQIAARYLAPLQCRDGGTDDTGRPRQVCDAPSRRIVLIDPNNKQVFAFVGRYEFSAAQGYDLKPVVYDQLLSAQDAEGFQVLANFYHDVRKTFEQLSLQSAQHGVSVNLVGASAVAAAQTGQCPTETALNYYLDSEKMNSLKTSVAVAATRDGHQLYQYVHNQPRLSSASAGVTVGPLAYSAQIEMSKSAVRYVHEFKQSEIPNSVINDRLVFDVSMSGFDSKNWPILGLTLRLTDSKIANSYGADGLNTKTDNPCVAETLNRLAANGSIQMRSGGKGIERIDGGARFEGSPRETCTIEVYQWGKLQGRFIVPKTKTSCSEQ